MRPIVFTPDYELSVIMSAGEADVHGASERLELGSAPICATFDRPRGMTDNHRRQPLPGLLSCDKSRDLLARMH